MLTKQKSISRLKLICFKNEKNLPEQNNIIPFIHNPSSYINSKEENNNKISQRTGNTQKYFLFLPFRKENLNTQQAKKKKSAICKKFPIISLRGHLSYPYFFLGFLFPPMNTPLEGKACSLLLIIRS